MPKYSLADYILSVQANDPSLRSMFPNVAIGGQGSMIGSVSAEIDNDLFTTESFATGAWVHNKNLAKSGKVNVDISQLSEIIVIFKKMCNIFYAGDYNGFTLTLMDSKSNKVFTAIDCYLTKIPAQQFQNTAQNQTWIFTCGEITFD